jgi:hypothetical protein
MKNGNIMHTLFWDYINNESLVSYDSDNGENGSYEGENLLGMMDVGTHECDVENTSHCRLFTWNHIVLMYS